MGDIINRISLIDLINLSIGISGLTMSLLGLLVTTFYHPLDRVTRRYCICIFSALVGFTAIIIFDQLIQRKRSILPCIGKGPWK